MVYFVLGLLSAMGNRPSCEGLSHCELPDPTGHSRRSIQVHLSEEDYLPMTVAMKRSLLAKNKFERIVPSKTVVEESRNRTDKRDVGVEPRNELDRGNEGSEGHLAKPLEIERDDEDFVTFSEVRESFFNVEPVVTVLDRTAVEIESRGQLWASDGFVEEKTTVERLSEAYKKSPTTTNRRFSLIDMNTGIKKSRFTLELEDRLRQSKLELGFADELDNWKEFNYALSPQENKNKSGSVNGEKIKSASLKSFRSRTKDSPRDHLQYCAHNCQILGLCSVGRPEVLPAREPSIFDNEVNWKYDVTPLMMQRSDELNGVKKHPKREDCNCDICTLAYLTSMDLPGDGDRKVRSVGGVGEEEDLGRGNDFRERIKIIDNGDVCKSLEVSVSNPMKNRSAERRLYIKNRSSLRSNVSVHSIEEDTTNYRIKKKFNINSSASFGNTYNNYNQSVKDVAIIDLHKFSDSSPAGYKIPSDTKVDSRQTADNYWNSLPINSSSDTRKSSVSTLGASVSSSISTVMSYKRVRQIFQTIIEKNRSRKRTRRNIHKFKEMEDLGLGEVKNNRWYPSDSKTWSIWRDMHASVQGMEAQFRKYHRMSPRSRRE